MHLFYRSLSGYWLSNFPIFITIRSIYHCYETIEIIAFIVYFYIILEHTCKWIFEKITSKIYTTLYSRRFK